MRELQVPCSNCIGCKQEYANKWAVRCYHESQLHDRNCFITLTYDDEHSGTDLVYGDFQRFAKRLRKSLGPFRYFVAGEYGARGRPHFHACLFGLDFPDMAAWAKSEKGFAMFRSKQLEDLWVEGFSTVQELSYATARYCAKYAAKSLSVTRSDRVPEFVHMSLKPGIGASWLDKFHADVYQAGDGSVVLAGGARVKAPRYYDRRFLEMNADAMEYLKMVREARARARAEDDSPERLSVREVVASAQYQFFKREVL
jgi:hypothetical protein